MQYLPLGATFAEQDRADTFRHPRAQDRFSPGYSYSPANEAANLTWDDATLDKYLDAPRAMIPGTKMTYAGVKDAGKRADLIAYLGTLK